jgi:hypothetical protein
MRVERSQHRAARAIHVGLRFQQRGFGAADATGAETRVDAWLGSLRDPVSRREVLDDAKADVVAGPLVVGTWIAESYHQLHAPP